MLRKGYIFFLLLSVFQSISYSQQPTLKGSVTDSLSQPLEFANVIAHPRTKKVAIAFSIADEKGQYKLYLKKGASYTIATSYMGYDSYSFVLDSVQGNKLKNIILKPSSEKLDEVIIIQQLPISVKEDTITYRTKAFVTGEERKLKDVLQKLPGVEVNKNGEVTVQGKKITKMLVEDKDFFGGGTKLAVENIPADVVKEVEIIDDYNKVGFLKGLTDFEDTAMNIKLKKDKKHFVFGDIVSGLGNEAHYLVQANLFYYAPKTNLSYIGNLNDIGYKAFTFKDYMSFQGGISKIFKNTKSFFRTSQSNFAEFFENPDYIANTAKFSAINWKQTLHKNLDFNMYGLFSDNLTHTQTVANNQYLNNGVVYLTENRAQKQQNGKSYGMGKLALEYNPNKTTTLEYNFFAKLSSIHFIENTSTLSSEEDNYIKRVKTGDIYQIKQDFEWNKKLNRKQTLTFSVSHLYNKDLPTTQWQTDKPILQGLIPLVDEENYSIHQIKETKTNQLNTIFKHYWILNNLNHIYTSVGNQYLNQFYTTNELQILSDASLNNFDSAGFGNDMHYRLNDFYTGIQYKFKKKKTTFKFGIFGHSYHWESLQNEDAIHNKYVVLPELMIRHEFKKSEKLILKYAIKSTFSDASKYADRFYLSDFNSLYKGNPDLQNELQHDTSLHYYKFSMYKDIMINGSILYTNKIYGIQNQYQLQGIDQYLIPVMVSNPENNWQFNGSIRKGINDYYLKLKSTLSLTDYKQNINGASINTKSFSQFYGIVLGTTFDKYPNIDLGYDIKYRNYSSGNTDTRYASNEPFVEFSYDFLKGFILKTDYRKSDFKREKQTTSTYEFANASLFYQKENSPFGFEIQTTNLLDVGFKTDSNFSDYLISEKQTYIMPFTLVFKLSYKL